VVDGEQAFLIFLAGGAGEKIVELLPAGDFLHGGDQALFNFLGVILRAFVQAAAQFLNGRGRDKDGDEATGEEGFGGGGLADGGRALHVNVEDDVLALVDEHDDIAAARAVVVSVNEGVLKKFAGGEGGVKLCRGKEAVIDAVLLAGARGAAGAGDEALGARDGGEQRVAQGGFSAARGAGKNKNQSRAIGQGRERRHERGKLAEKNDGRKFINRDGGRQWRIVRNQKFELGKTTQF